MTITKNKELDCWDYDGLHFDSFEAADRHAMRCQIVALNERLAGYQRLHDGLSDMIEGGRLKKCHIPDDYQWLVANLTKLTT